SHGIDVPVFSGQRSVAEARFWRRTMLLSIFGGVIAVGLLGFWGWYSWFGSRPKPIFSMAFSEPAYSGHSAFVGPDQILTLHGGILGRHDMKSHKEIWSRSLIDTNEVRIEVAKELKQADELIYKANNEAWEHVPKRPDPAILAKQLERAQAADLQLRVRGQNVWVISPRNLVRYDWDTGKPVKEIPIPSSSGGPVAQ